MEQIRVVDRELVVHVCVPLTGPHAAEAADLVHEVWRRGREVLGAGRDVPSTGLPSTLPTDLRTGLESKALAVQEDADGDVQMMLRREHDLLVLSLLAAAPRLPRVSSPDWADHRQRLEQAVPSSRAVLGTAHLYLAKVSGPSPPEVFLAECPVSPVPNGGWCPLGLPFPARLSGWELTDPDLERAARTLVVTAPPEQDLELGRWTWSRGDPEEMPVLGRYLMHVAKLRYEVRVHRTYPSPATLSVALQEGADEVLRLAESALPGLPDRLAGLRLERARAARLVTVLKSLEHTAEIATSNARLALGASAGHLDPCGTVAADMELGDWFRLRLQDEIAYLEASMEGAQTVGKTFAKDLPGRGAAPHDEPTIGIVTALPEEFTAARVLLDGERRLNVPDDRAHYLVGTMPSADPAVPHRVVLTLLGDTGNDAAADACANLTRSFRSVGYVLMVGIAAGVPDLKRPERHVRLGDIVVSTWGIVDYDHVVDRPEGVGLRQPFPRPSPLLSRQAKFLEAEEMTGRRPWESLLERVVAALPGFARPPAETDVIYPSDEAAEPVPHPVASGHRPGLPKVHQGFIGSADRALRNAATRDRLAVEHDLRALEMEGKGVGGSGFSNGLEWLVVRGISDYGDVRTGKSWRNYASAVAAAYARALLAECPPLAPRGGQPGST